MCVHLWVAVTASLRFVLKLHGQYFSKQIETGCVCVFMGCCDSIPQICFKVAWTIFFQNKLKQGVCVCIHGLL